MRMKLMWVRGLTATVLFLMLAQVNVWADTQTHLVLAVGYRTFLLGAPLFMFLGLSGGMRLALALCLMGTIGAYFSVNTFTMTLFALGMAVSGYLAKFISSHTSEGAADNKVSLNIGSLASGLLLMSITSKPWLLVLGGAFLAATLILSFRMDWSHFEESPSKVKTSVEGKREFRMIPLMGWSLIGIATGIKLTGIFTILPQYLIARLGALPTWFGSLVILNSIVVILLQHRVLAFLDRVRPSMTFFMSLSAMAFLALPGVLRVENQFLSIGFILLLTLGECALSRYDRLAKDDGYLFPKEVMVGVGSFITVALSRGFSQEIYWSGLVGMACLTVGTVAVLMPRRVGSSGELAANRVFIS